MAMALVQLLLLLFPNVFCVCFHFHVFKDKAEKTLRKKDKKQRCVGRICGFFFGIFTAFPQFGNVTCALHGKHHNFINSEVEPNKPPSIPIGLTVEKKKNLFMPIPSRN